MVNKPHKPKSLPPVDLDISVYADALAAASLEIGRLDGRQKNLPNPLLLVSPLAAKEATVSSRIEGTISTISDVFLFESGGSPEEFDAAREVSNYRRAMLWGIDALSRKELSLEFINHLHSMLLERTRGHEVRGKFRSNQVIIGPLGAKTYEEATYIPPEAIQIPNLMHNLEEYIQSEHIQPLVAAALTHYQFEAIHPYEDGNGRIGRLLVPLFLYKKDVLHYPILYLSGQFDKDRDVYISALHNVDETGSYDAWIRFFLEAVRVQACETQKLIDEIDTLFAETRRLASSIQSPYAQPLVEFLFKQPVFFTTNAQKEIAAAPLTVYRLLKEFEALGILVKNTKVRPQPHYFTGLLDLLSK